MRKKTIKLIKDKPLYILSIFGSFLLLSLSVVNVTFLSNPADNGVLGLKIVTDSNHVLLQERFFWKTLLSKYPTYFAGWIELTKIEVQLENISAAKVALEKAREINPNSSEVKRLFEVLAAN